MSKAQSEELVLYGFHRSTYVSVARLVMHAKGVPFQFYDVESDIYTQAHFCRHPFCRVPALKHGDFWLYETSAIAFYIEENFPGPGLLPEDRRARALVHQWISNANAYFYPCMIYYLVHERIVFPDLGIEGDEAVVAAALPKIDRALAVFDDALTDNRFVVGDGPTLADFFLLPMLTALGFTSEGRERLDRLPRVMAWTHAMGELPEVIAFRATLPPRAPIEHARRWATEHRPGVRSI